MAFAGVLYELLFNRFLPYWYGGYTQERIIMISTHVSLRLKFFAVAALALAGALPLRADIIELTNGDHYRGKVVSMNSNTIEFNSEIQGKVHLPRNKVAQITFVEVAPKVIARTNATSVTTVPTAAAPVSAAPLVANSAATSTTTSPHPATADEVVAQMRREGVQPQLMNQIQEQIFGKASPEASQKFEQTMNGLMSGQISVQDLRKQAQTAIQQARDAKKDLGGDAGEMLDGYIGILEKFVAETSPTTPTAPAPAATAPVAVAPTK